MKKSYEPIYEHNLLSKDEAIARHIILKNIKHLDGDGIAPNSEISVHVIIVGTSELSFAVARQVALTAHYPNFDEKSSNNRTKITIISEKEADTIFLELKKATGNLLDISKYSYLKYCDDNFDCIKVENSDSFLDLEFEILTINKSLQEKYFNQIKKESNNKLISVLFEKTDLFEFSDRTLLNCFYQNFEIDAHNYDEVTTSVDISKAMIIKTIYNEGIDMKNVTISDKSNIHVFDKIINIVAKFTRSKKIRQNWEGISNDEKLSNIICADCLESKYRSCNKADIKNKIGLVLIDNLSAFSKSEHTRWCVEKLILNYRPYTKYERFKYTKLSNKDKKLMKNNMKNSVNKAHIDICSNNRLISTDPDSFKFDCFITLAINKIINPNE